jgi:hypothetical protein
MILLLLVAVPPFIANHQGLYEDTSLLGLLDHLLADSVHQHPKTTSSTPII